MTVPLVPSDVEPYRRELTAYCYRMLGSGFEAEDAVQETMIKALRAADAFEGRSSVRSWLYRIATNVCIDMSRQVQRRARPREMGPASPPDESLLGAAHPEALWVTPIADQAVLSGLGDPAEIAEQRESIRLAFVTALQHLPARQRASLVLCEVLRWPVADAAELLGTTVAAVNSALQRARATLAEPARAAHPLIPCDADRRGPAGTLRGRLRALRPGRASSALLHDDAIQSMPPFALWLQGAHHIVTWMVQPGPSACHGSRLVATMANGCPAFGQYKPDPAGGWAPWAIQVLEISGGKVAEMAFFLDLLDHDRLFPAFGLPLHLDA